MQVAPELSPPPPPPGTVGVNITGGNNGSSPIVTVNATAGPASPGASPVVQQPPLASPLAPSGSLPSHCQLACILMLSHSSPVHIMYQYQLRFYVLTFCIALLKLVSKLALR